jgi:hypothetical protein
VPLFERFGVDVVLSGPGFGGAADGAVRVVSDCHFRKTATEYDRKPGMKWLSCTAK